MSTTKIVICGAARTPIGAIGGGLSPLLPRDLMIHIAKAVVASAKVDPKEVEYVSVGQVFQDVRAMNPARTVADFIGAPVTTPGTTLMENCASGGAAIHDIARRILCGEIELGIAGGCESMSNIPRLLTVGRTKGQLYGDMKLIDGLQNGLVDNTIGKGVVMGLLTEDLATKYKVSREMQDDIAFRSHKNAWDTWEKGLFDYVTPVETPGKKGKKNVVARDEGPKQLTREWFAQQKPHFKPEGGTITVANASSTNDGAAAVVLASEKRAKELGLPILAELKGYGNIGCPREFMGEGAFKVLPRLFQRAGVTMADVDYFELNEAFAAVVGGAKTEFPELDIENKVNQWGSGVALGHPVGCTGCRQVVDMVHQLRKRNKSLGITTRCVGGGIGSGEVIALYK